MMRGSTMVACGLMMGCAGDDIEMEQDGVGGVPEPVVQPAVDTANDDEETKTLEVDDIELAICDLREVAPITLPLGASKAEANTAVIVPDNASAWVLTMPETGDGWFTIEVPDWMTIVRLSTDQDVLLDVQGGDPFSELGVNTSCPDEGLSDQRMAFHEWGAYQVRIEEGAPSEVWFTLIKE
ncbi:MAG: hypothetical protein ACON4N_08190 [Myxococcota bacterium]